MLHLYCTRVLTRKLGGIPRPSDLGYSDLCFFRYHTHVSLWAQGLPICADIAELKPRALAARHEAPLCFSSYTFH